MKKFICTILAAVLMLSLLAGCAGNAEKPADSEKKLDYPNRPIKMVIPWAAGGNSDLTARAMAPLCEKYLRTTMNVVNREGANATVAYTEMNNVEPDGYTLCWAATGNFVTMAFTQKLEYSFENTTPIIGISSSPLAFMVKKDSEIQSIDDLKAKSGDFTFGMCGTRGGTQVSVATLFKEAGIEGELVPYSSGAQIAPALLGDQVDVVFAQVQALRGQIESGDVKVICFLSDERCVDYPDVPTVGELGYKNVVDGGIMEWIFAPAGLDPEIQDYLCKGFAELKKDPEFLKILTSNKCYNWDADHQEVTAKITELKTQIEPVVNELGWAAE